jgi:hypothetical protein
MDLAALGTVLGYRPSITGLRASSSSTELQVTPTP